jgi:LPXTG-motif cell wall-anchored protein/uncharacterized repeat protein (TIGR01451 family)
MDRLFIRKVSRMLRDNRRRRDWRGIAAVAGAVVAVVCGVLLMYPAHALTGGDSLRNAIADQSAVFSKAAGTGDDAWQAGDPTTPVSADSSLRLRVAFKLPAGTLANGSVLQYQLPEGVSIDTSKAPVSGDVVSGVTVTDPTNANATKIGSYQIKDGVLTLTFNDDVTRANAGAPAGDASDSAAAEQAQAGSDLSGYVDIDLGFDQLACDDSGLVTIKLNDAVTLKVTKAAEQKDQEAVADATTDGTGETDDSSSQDADAQADAISAAAPVARVAARPGSGSVDLTDHLTGKSKVEKLVNGVWTESTEFTDGDEVRVNLQYHLDKGTITTDTPNATYQLPDGIRPVSPESGDVTMDGKDIGDYTIGTDGKVTIQFSHDAMQLGNGVSGTLMFKGKVSNASGGDSTKIHFGGSATDITVSKKKDNPQTDAHDINVNKTATLSSDRSYVDYTVTASTTKGTEGTVTIGDHLDKYNSSNANPSYDTSSLSVKKVDANGNTYSVSYSSDQVTWDTNASDGPHFKISGLPQLNAGEKYVVTYRGNVNATSGAQAAKVENGAYAKSGNNSSSDWKSVGWTKDIQKSGTYDKDGHIIWSIWVNPNGADISNWVVQDDLSKCFDGCKMVQQFIVETEDGSYSQYFDSSSPTSLDFRFSSIASQLTDAQKHSKFRITVYTNAPSGDVSVSNTAEEWGNPGTGYAKDTGTADVVHRTTDVVKKHVADQFDNGKPHTETWYSTITLPEGNIKSYEYVDTIGNAQTSEGVDLGSDSHYATASELEQAFKSTIVDNKVAQAGCLAINVDNYNKYLYAGAGQQAYYDSYYENEDGLTQNLGIMVTYYDAGGKEVPATDSTTRVKSFKVTVTPKASITAQSMTIGTEQSPYKTHIDTTGAEEGSTWTVSNTGAVGDKSSTDTYTFTNPKTFDKMVKTGSKDGNDIFKSGNANVNYDDVNGTLTYRLMLTTSANDNNKDIIITDTLPEGATYVDGSLYAKFFKSEYDKHDTNYSGTDFTGANKPQVTSSQKDGRTVLTITIPKYTYANGYETVAVYYSLSVAQDPSWAKGEEKTYSNNASWNSHTASTNTTVKREFKVLSKTGVQLDKDGKPVQTGSYGKAINPTGKLRYYVQINTGAKDLNPNSDELELTDTFGAPNTLEPTIDPTSIKLYAYDPAKENGLDTSREIKGYKAKYDEATHKITVTLPDKTACVLVYEYQLNDNFSDYMSVSNSASLDGQYSTGGSVNLREVTSSATATQKQIVIYKVDEDDFSKVLSDTYFEMDYWDKANNSWKQKTTTSTLKTDEAGKIEYDLEDNVDHLDNDTLYRLRETKAKDGYAANAVRYFIWKDGSSTDDTAYSTSGAANAQVDRSAIKFFGSNGGKMFVTNEYTRVTVQKNWANADGSETSVPSGSSVKLQLYRSTKIADPNDSVTVTVTGEGNGSNPWNKPIVYLDGNNASTGAKTIKKGSKFVFRVHDWNIKYKVFVNGVEKGEYANNGVEGTSITLDSVNENTTVLVQEIGSENAPSSITSETWTDPQQVLDDSTSAPVGDPVTVDANGGWTNNWDNLAKDDGNGNKYYYTVKELGYTVGGTYHDLDKETDGAYTVSYGGNTGIQTGTITVTNSAKKNQGYELPSTGGTPSSLPAVGGAIALGACALLALRWRRSNG